MNAEFSGDYFHGRGVSATTRFFVTRAFRVEGLAPVFPAPPDALVLSETDGEEAVGVASGVTGIADSK